MFSDELLKTLAEDGGQSNGPPVIQACDFIFLLSMREPQTERGTD